MEFTKDMYSVREVSRILGVTYLTALRYVQSGYIKGVKIKSFWRIPREELAKICSQGKEDKDEQPREVHE